MKTAEGLYPLRPFLVELSPIQLVKAAEHRHMETCRIRLPWAELRSAIGRITGCQYVDHLVLPPTYETLREREERESANAILNPKFCGQAVLLKFTHGTKRRSPRKEKVLISPACCKELVEALEMSSTDSPSPHTSSLVECRRFFDTCGGAKGEIYVNDDYVQQARIGQVYRTLVDIVAAKAGSAANDSAMHTSRFGSRID